MATYRARRSGSDWQRLIEAQVRSDLSAKQFCAEHDLGYPSFLHWKRKLSSASSDRSVSPSTPTFIELTGPIVQRQTGEVGDASTSPTWLAELDLGGGICLRLANPV